MTDGRAACRPLGLAAIRVLTLLPLVSVLAWLPTEALANDREPAAHEGTTAAATGARFYEAGTGPSGEVVEARLADGSPVTASQVACVNCHQRSGLGSSEGGVVAPVVTWDALASPRADDLRSPFQSSARIGEGRPAYDAGALGRLLREGVDPAGREIAKSMPRYQIDEATLAALVTHLQYLSRQVADTPGVTATEIHFATVLGPDVDEATAAEVISVLEAFAGVNNVESRNERGRARRGVFYQDVKNRAYRRWVVHPWRLEGRPDEWPAQLDAHLEARPVFALLGGITLDTWAPVDAFCNTQRVPCILPSSQLPSGDATGGFTLWPSLGFDLEAALLVDDLRKRGIAPDVGIRIVRDAQPARNALAAERIAEVLRMEGYRDVTLHLRSERWWTGSGGATGTPSATVTVGLVALDAFEEIAGRVLDKAMPTYFSGIVGGSDLAGALPHIENAAVLHVFDDPRRMPAVTRRATVWLKGRGIDAPHSRLQLDTYLAAVVTGNALRHMKTNFSRDYFLERIEHGLDNAVYRSVYPRISLGPRQRIASKSGRLLSLDGPPRP